jgi:hypothetical protein
VYLRTEGMARERGVVRTENSILAPGRTELPQGCPGIIPGPPRAQKPGELPARLPVFNRPVAAGLWAQGRNRALQGFHNRHLYKNHASSRKKTPKEEAFEKVGWMLFWFRVTRADSFLSSAAGQQLRIHHRLPARAPHLPGTRLPIPNHAAHAKFAPT